MSGLSGSGMYDVSRCQLLETPVPSGFSKLLVLPYFDAAQSPPTEPARARTTKSQAG